MLSCVDGCPENPSKSTPGACGCLIDDRDENLNGTMDCLETTAQPNGLEDAYERGKAMGVFADRARVCQGSRRPSTLQTNLSG